MINKQLQDLHDAYDKHEVKPVAFTKDQKRFIPYRYGVCACGAVFARDFQSNRWDKMTRSMADRHMPVSHRYKRMMQEMFKEII